MAEKSEGSFPKETVKNLLLPVAALFAGLCSEPGGKLPRPLPEGPEDSAVSAPLPGREAPVVAPSSLDRLREEAESLSVHQATVAAHDWFMDCVERRTAQYGSTALCVPQYLSGHFPSSSLCALSGPDETGKNWVMLAVQEGEHPCSSDPEDQSMCVDRDFVLQNTDPAFAEQLFGTEVVNAADFSGVLHRTESVLGLGSNGNSIFQSTVISGTFERDVENLCNIASKVLVGDTAGMDPKEWVVMSPWVLDAEEIHEIDQTALHIGGLDQLAKDYKELVKDEDPSSLPPVKLGVRLPFGDPSTVQLPSVGEPFLSIGLEVDTYQPVICTDVDCARDFLSAQASKAEVE